MKPDTEATSPSPRGPIASVVRGIWLLGRGDAEGLNFFQSGRDAVLSAMAPSLALYLVAAIGQVMAGPSAMALTNILLLLSALLARLVITQALAARWSRQGLWTRYAAAALWCDWLPGLFSLIAGLILHLALPKVGDTRAGMAGVFIVVELYDLWLSWFVARAGLVLRWYQAAMLVLAVLIVTLALYVTAAVLPPHYNLLKEVTTPLFSPS